MQFKLPDIGEGLAEGEIVKWLVKEGQQVAEGDPLVEVMTDKATVQIPSPRAGTIVKLLVDEGATVPIGTALVEIGEGGGAAAAPAPMKPQPEQEAPRAAPAHADAGAAARQAAAAGASSGGNGRGATAPAAGTAVAEAPPPRPSGKVLAAPATRKLARELGIDIGLVAGSGPRGRVTKDDVSRFASGGAAAAPAAPTAPRAPALPPRAPVALPAGPEEERVPLRGIRKRIAEGMARSKQTAAHFSYVDECDMTEIVALRSKFKARAEERGVKLTYLSFIAKACLAALPEFPLLNASLDDASQEVVYHNRYHLGISVDTDNGLIVPVIKNADQLSILQLGSEIARLAEGARDMKLRPDEVTGSTFTITSAGNIGGLFATPIVNWPNVAIVGVNKIHDRPVVRDGQIVVRKMMYLSMSLDHRVVDGAVAARFCNRVIELLESPGMMLLSV